MKNLFYKIIVILSFVLTLVFINPLAKVTASTDSLNSDEKPIFIQAEDLIKEYKENPKAADEKYKGKMLTVAGEVGGIRHAPKPVIISVHTDLYRDPADKSKLQEVGCVLDKSEKVNSESIISSQRIMTTGRNAGIKPSVMMMRDDNAESEYIALENCRIETESPLNDSTNVDSDKTKTVGLPDASSGKIPSDAELQVLLRSTIQVFADALESGDFTKFHANTATVSILHKATPERLKEVYGGQKYNVEAYRWTNDKKAKFFRPPAFTEYTDSIVGSPESKTFHTSLNLVGNYEEWTADSHKIVEFSIQYLAEGKDWKLLVINALKPLEANFTKQTKPVGNMSPPEYPVPENLADLITSDEIFKSFASSPRSRK